MKLPILLAFALIIGSLPGVSAEWSASPQPKLAAEIENAPSLPVEEISQPTQTVRHEGVRVIANPEGGPDLFVIYYKGYQGPATAFAIDTNDGSVTRSEIPEGRNTHLQGRAQAENGEVFYTLQMVGGGLELWRYDPVTNQFEALSAFGHAENLMGQGNQLEVGVDGSLYGTVGSRETREAAFYQIDPASGAVRTLGTAVDIHSSPYAGSLIQAASGLLYAVYGKTPYRLIEFDPEKGAGKEIATANAQGFISLKRTSQGEVQFSIARAESGVTRDGVYSFSADDGTMREIKISERENQPISTAKVKEPTETNKATKKSSKAEYMALLNSGVSPAEAKARVLGKRSQGTSSVTEGKADKLLSNQVEWDGSLLDPSANPDQLGRIRYRLPTESDWHIATLDPPLYGEAIIQLTTLPDQRIFGTANNRGGHFVYDPAKGKTTFLGRTQLQHHSSVISGNRIYFSGYPSSLLWSWDFTGPDWIQPRATKPGRNQESFGASSLASDNPRQLGALREFSGVHMATCAAGDRAGRVYFAGRWYRDGNGGGVGWWDPANESAGGFWEELSTLQVVDCCATDGGGLIVLSTQLVSDKVLQKTTPESAALCIIDPEQREAGIAEKIVPIARARTTGLIASAGEGRIIGIAPSVDNEEKWILYGVDVSTGDVLFSKTMPGISSPKLSASEMLHSYYGNLVVANDGGIWMNYSDILLRIDPATAHIRVVGRPAESLNSSKKSSKNSTRSFRRFAISGGDIYLTGSPWLRRIRGVAVY